MRLVDYFIEPIRYARLLLPSINGDENSADQVRERVQALIAAGVSKAQAQGYDNDSIDNAKYAVVAYIDELLLTSNWREKGVWQQNPLQRIHFSTTNAGAGFYDRLNKLSKHGPDFEAREVYSLCLGLGFLGKYFRPDDRQKYEEIKSFNLALLMPDEAQRNLDTATLFPSAYQGGKHDYAGTFRQRINVYPIVIGAPIIALVALAYYLFTDISGLLSQIAALVK